MRPGKRQPQVAYLIEAEVFVCVCVFMFVFVCFLRYYYDHGPPRCGTTVRTVYTLTATVAGSVATAARTITYLG